MDLKALTSRRVTERRKAVLAVSAYLDKRPSRCPWNSLVGAVATSVELDTTEALPLLERCMRVADAGGVRRLRLSVSRIVTVACAAKSVRILGLIAGSPLYVNELSLARLRDFVATLTVTAEAAGVLRKLVMTLVQNDTTSAFAAVVVDACCKFCESAVAFAAVEVLSALADLSQRAPHFTRAYGDEDTVARFGKACATKTAPLRAREAVVSWVAATGHRRLAQACNDSLNREDKAPLKALEVQDVLLAPSVAQPGSLDAVVLARVKRPELDAGVFDVSWKAHVVEVAGAFGKSREEVVAARLQWCDALATAVESFVERDDAPWCDLAVVSLEARDLYGQPHQRLAHVWGLAVEGFRRRLARARADLDDETRLLLQQRARKHHSAVDVAAATGLAILAAIPLVSNDVLSTIVDDLARAAQEKPLHVVLARLGCDDGRRDGLRRYASRVANAVFYGNDPVGAVRSLVALLVGFEPALFVDDPDPWQVSSPSLDKHRRRDVLDDADVDGIVLTAIDKALDDDVDTVRAAFGAALLGKALAPLVSPSRRQSLAARASTAMSAAVPSLRGDVSLDAAHGMYVAAVACEALPDVAGLNAALHDLGHAALERVARSTTGSPDETAITATPRDDDDDDLMASDDDDHSDKPKKSLKIVEKDDDSMDSDEDMEECEDKDEDPEPRDDRARRLWLARLATRGAKSTTRIAMSALEHRADRVVLAVCVEDLRLSVDLLELAWKYDDGSDRKAGFDFHVHVDTLAPVLTFRRAASIAQQRTDLRTRCGTLVAGTAFPHLRRAVASRGAARAARLEALRACEQWRDAQVVTAGLVDADLECRLEAARSASSLSLDAILATVPVKAVYRDVDAHQKPPHRALEATALVAVGALAATLHLKALFWLVEFAAVRARRGDETAARLAQLNIARAARDAGFESAPALLVSCLGRLARAWCKSGRKLATFPTFCCGLDPTASLHGPSSSFMKKGPLVDVAALLAAAGSIEPFSPSRPAIVLATALVAREVGNNSETATAALSSLKKKRTDVLVRDCLATVVRAIFEATDDRLALLSRDNAPATSWSVAAQRALDRLAIDYCGVVGGARMVLDRAGPTPLVLRLGARLLQAQRPQVKAASDALALALDVLGRHDAAAVAATARLTSALERDDGDDACNTLRRSCALDLLSRLAPDLKASLAATAAVVAASFMQQPTEDDSDDLGLLSSRGTSAELADAAAALRALLEEDEVDDVEDLVRCGRRLVTTDDDRTAAAVPDLEPGTGPLERPRRIRALALFRRDLTSGRDLPKPATRLGAHLRTFAAATRDPRERGLALDCAAELAKRHDVADDDAIVDATVEVDGVEARKLVLTRELARGLVSTDVHEASAALRSVVAVARSDDYAILSTAASKFRDDPHCAMLASYEDDVVDDEYDTPVAKGWLEHLTSDLVGRFYKGDDNGAVGDDPMLGATLPSCAASKAFARLALPAIVYDVVAARKGEDATKRAAARTLVAARLRECLESEENERPAVAIEVLDFVRSRELELFLRPKGKYVASPPFEPFLMPHGPPLEVPTKSVAAAANRARKPASAVFYAELVAREPSNVRHHQKKKRRRMPDAAESDVRRTLLEAYGTLGDADALRALSWASSANETAASRQSMLEALYTAEGAWSSLLGLADAALDAGDDRLQPTAALALRRLGLSHVLDAYTRSASHNEAALARLAEDRDEAAWRCGRWESIDDEHQGVNGALRRGLARLARRDCTGALRALRLARDRAGADDNARRLGVVAEARAIVEAVRCRLRRDDSSALAAPPCRDDEDDDMLAAREAWLRAARAALGRTGRLDEAIRTTALAAADRATKAGKVDAAVAAAARVARDAGGNEQWRRVLELTEAKILWARGRVEDASRRVRGIVDRDEAQAGTEDDVRFEALRLAGAWAVEARSLPSSTVLDRYLRPAAAARSGDPKRLAEARFELGEYVARLHAAATAHLASTEWRQAERVARDRRAELDECKAKKVILEAKKRTTEVKSDIHNIANEIKLHERELANDEVARATVRDAPRAYLTEALEAWCAVVEATPDFDLGARAAARIVSLWFRHAFEGDNAHGASRRLAQLSMGGGATVGAFAPLLYQLSSRLGGGSSDAATALENLVLRLCEVVPDHAVLQLMALAKGDALGYNPRNPAAADQFRRNAAGAGRLGAAKRLLATKRRQGDTGISTLLELGDAYVDLALVDGFDPNAVVPFADLFDARPALARFFRPRLFLKKGRGDKSTSSSCKIVTRLPAARDAGRGNTRSPRVWKYEPTINVMASGVHKPVTVRVYGDDGNAYKELVKGHDDTRQDAVMQQVFQAVNDMVRRSSGSSNAVRTYNVVPMSPDTGVIEWVERTMPLGAYLSGSKGAHSRYFPGDASYRDCQKRLYKAHNDAKSHRDPTALLLDVYTDVCDHFQPAFRYFFIEFFGDDAQTWLRKTRAYAASVAHASMVGYVLGIGDRHGNNILICTRTAQVVHIDFGIALEQGHTLAIPETVPFRLTRDVVDGMGLAKTDGLFLTSAVSLAATLRDNATALLTILDVLVHDPLYRWLLTPRDQRARQRDEDEVEAKTPRRRDGEDISSSSNGGTPPAAAERALLRVRHKLQGYSDSGADVLSVEGQVKQLIADAMDPSNLCRIYYGWAPWL